MKKIFFKTLTVFIVLFAFSLGGFASAIGYGGSGNFPMTLEPDEDGFATKTFGQQGEVTLDVPIDTVENKTTFKVKMGGVNANMKPDDDDKDIVGDKVFTFTATEWKNTPVISFTTDLKITIELQETGDDQGLYYFDGDEWVWILNCEDSSVEFYTPFLGTFAIIQDGACLGGDCSVAVDKKSNKNNGTVAKFLVFVTTLWRGMWG